jgi:hypothetical protein
VRFCIGAEWTVRAGRSSLVTPKEDTMRHLIRPLALAAACMAPLAAAAADPLVRFEGGIGSQPLAAGATVNDVLGVPPGGRPWVISSLSADIKVDGSLNVEGRGLLLGGGGNIGRTGGQRVNALLFCDGARHISEQQVLLEPNGDFRITGFLVPRPPALCNNAILLIVNANGSWFAAGIPKQ